MGCRVKWIWYPLQNKRVIKGQALANFVTKFANVLEVEEVMELVEPFTWNLFVDGSTEKIGSRVGMVLVSLEDHKLNSAMQFGFKATSNLAKYEAFLVGLRLAKEMQVKMLFINSNSQLIVSQINGNFTARDKGMAAYLKLVMDLLPSFKKFELVQIPRIENAHANALSKLASNNDS